MKTFISVILVLIFIPSLSSGQGTENKSEKKKNKSYRAWIELNNNIIPAEGILYEIGDSTLTLRQLNNPTTIYGKESTAINFRNINNICVRPSKNVLKGTIIGTITGISVGVAIGLSEQHDPNKLQIYSRQQEAVAGGALFGVLGAGVGAGLGALRIRIPIKGSFENFFGNNSRLKQYSVVK